MTSNSRWVSWSPASSAVDERTDQVMARFLAPCIDDVLKIGIEFIPGADGILHFVRLDGGFQRPCPPVRPHFELRPVLWRYTK